MPHTLIRLRARGFYETGQGSGSIVESILSQGHATDGDYDGDGKADLIVFRPSSGTWYTLQSLASTVSAVPFGLSTDVPVPGDYDGDGRTDLAVYRPGSSTWYFQQTTAGFTAVQWGLGGDVSVPADYDGDRKTDIAVYRPSNGGWFILAVEHGHLGDSDSRRHGRRPGAGRLRRRREGRRRGVPAIHR